MTHTRRMGQLSTPGNGSRLKVGVGFPMACEATKNPSTTNLDGPAAARPQPAPAALYERETYALRSGAWPTAMAIEDESPARAIQCLDTIEQVRDVSRSMSLPDGNPRVPSL